MRPRTSPSFYRRFSRRRGLEYMLLFFHLDLAFQRPFCRYLVEPGIEQSEAHVTESKDTSEEKEVSTPT